VLWAVLRALVGFGCAGLFVATESWLNAKATAATRGTVFAIYMVATYATFAGGQFMLNLASPTAFTLFALASILFCLALAVVTTTRAEQPLPVASATPLGELSAAAPVAVVGCLAGGIVRAPSMRWSRLSIRTDGRCWRSRPMAITWRPAHAIPSASCPTA
jgi:MFS family permease